MVSVEPGWKVIEARPGIGGVLASGVLVVVGQGKAKVVLSGESRVKADR